MWSGEAETARQMAGRKKEREKEARWDGGRGRGRGIGGGGGGVRRKREREGEGERGQQSKLIKPTTGESVGPVSHANLAQSTGWPGRFKK